MSELAQPFADLAEEVERLKAKVERLQTQKFKWEDRALTAEAEVERLREQDEVHWKTRRHLVAWNERLREDKRINGELHAAALERAQKAEAEVERLRADPRLSPRRL